MFPKLSLLVISFLASLQLSLAHPSVGNHAVAARHYNELDRRGDARLTWFKTGLGACGQYNSPSDPIVALNTHQWDGGSHCFEWITINWRGKTVKAQIVDECMECPYDALDLSNGLFASLADPVQVGTIYDASWSFGSGGGDDHTTTQQKTTAKPSTTSVKPTSTKTTSTHRTTSTSTSTSTTSTSQAVTTQTSTSAQPLPTVSPNDALYQLNMAYLDMSGLLVTN